MAMLPGLPARQDAGPLAEGLCGLADPRQRQGFVRTASAVIDWRGQTVSAFRQLGLLGNLPVLIAWGGEDRTIPPHHHQNIARQLPEPHLVEIARAGHYPHETDPAELLPALHRFLDISLLPHDVLPSRRNRPRPGRLSQQERRSALAAPADADGFTSRWHRVGARRLHVRQRLAVGSTAITCGLLHGLAVSHHYLIPTARCLRQRDVYVPDLLGFGLSDKRATV
jgi:pimeloyl-ACP methyl ester carboxylesterase